MTKQRSGCLMWAWETLCWVLSVLLAKGTGIVTFSLCKQCYLGYLHMTENAKIQTDRAIAKTINRDSQISGGIKGFQNTSQVMRTSDRRTHAYINFHQVAFLNIAQIWPYFFCITSVWIHVTFLGIGLFFKWNCTKLFFAVDRQLICNTPMLQSCKQFLSLI